MAAARHNPSSAALSKDLVRTEFLLLTQYQGQILIPVKKVRRDFFSHLTINLFLGKVGQGDILLPIIRMEDSQKSCKGVHLSDLATYIEHRRAEANKVLHQMSGC